MIDLREVHPLAKCWKALLVLFILLSLAAAGVLVLISRGDIGAGFAVSELGKAARRQLDAELSLSSLSGNPIKGLTMKNVALRRGRCSFRARGGCL